MTSSWRVEAICLPTNSFEAANLLQVFRRKWCQKHDGWFLFKPPATNVFEGLGALEQK